MKKNEDSANLYEFKLLNEDWRGSNEETFIEIVQICKKIGSIFVWPKKNFNLISSYIRKFNISDGFLLFYFIYKNKNSISSSIFMVNKIKHCASLVQL